jgi:hypothetical protein
MNARVYKNWAGNQKGSSQPENGKVKVEEKKAYTLLIK